MRIGFISFCILFASFLDVFAQDHRVYGTIEPVGSGIEVIISCENDDYHEWTDETGYYEISVEESGSCRIMIRYNERESDTVGLKIYRPSVEVNLRYFDKRGRYFLERQ